jgi:hypothetical protein
MGANTPVGFGGSTGDVWLGGTATARAREIDIAGTRAFDGAAAGGFSLGDPGRTVGLDVALLSLTTIHSGFFRRGAVDLQLTRRLGDDFSVAVGWESAVHWGYSESSSQYAVASRWIRLRPHESQAFSAVMLSAGVGNGRFQSEEDFTAGRHRLNPFGSLAVRVAAPLSVVADWTGQDLMLLGSLAPFRRLPLVGSLGVAEVLQRHSYRRLVASGGLSFNLRDLF